MAKKIAESYDILRKKFTYRHYQNLTEVFSIAPEMFEMIKDNAGTLSIGVAQAPYRDSVTKEKIMAWGDIAMYNAKEEAKKLEPRKSIVMSYNIGMTRPSAKINEE